MVRDATSAPRGGALGTVPGLGRLQPRRSKPRLVFTKRETLRMAGQLASSKPRHSKSDQ
jgi:hypothetical protein